MAKDVDLSSKEWTDLVFEGKVKDFGAYQLRRSSDRRHNLAMLYTIIGLALVILGFWAYGLYAEQKAQEEKERQLRLLQAKQQEFEEAQKRLEAELEAMDEPEIDDVIEPIQEEEIQALQEEILNTEQFTEFITVKDEDAKEVKTVDDVKGSETAIGNVTFLDGTNDVMAREHKNEVIVEEKVEKPVEKKVEEQIFTAVEQMPMFPGGDTALMKYLSSNIRYPAAAAENGVQGRVTVQFVVQKDGSVGQVKVLRGKDPDLDKEAVRVVKTLPKFVPGKMNGQAVAVWYTLPVNFKLQDR